MNQTRDTVAQHCATGPPIIGLHNVITIQCFFVYIRPCLYTCCATNGASQDIKVCCKCVFCIKLCVILPHLGVKICTPQDHFRCGVGCYHTHMPQKTMPGMYCLFMGNFPQNILVINRFLFLFCSVFFFFFFS